MFETMPSTWCCTASIVASVVLNQILLVRVEAEVLVDLEDARQLGRQPFGMPALDRLVPPHGPFPARQPVDRLEVHHGAKSFDVIHRRRHLCIL